MKPNPDFYALDRSFWAHVKLVSERLGYSNRKTKTLRRYTPRQVADCLAELGSASEQILSAGSSDPTEFGRLLVSYLNFRAETLETQVLPNLMDRDEARIEFERIKERVRPKCHLPMNKQKKEKRHESYLACLINMLTEEALGSVDFDDNPRGLTVVTDRVTGAPIRTFTRWMDGAYPSVVDPIAVWELKEYYGTTTFGSRVADGVYETMLDGEEFAELLSSEGRKVCHYLIVDDRFTWWKCGRSYLCRLIDIIHMGLVDEVLFGREVVSRWPTIVGSWVR